MTSLMQNMIRLQGNGNDTGDGQQPGTDPWVSKKRILQIPVMENLFKMSNFVHSPEYMRIKPL